jgi:hypothetical protein
MLEVFAVIFACLIPSDPLARLPGMTFAIML